MTAWLLRHFVKNYENVKDANVRTQYGSLAGLVGIVCNLLLVAGKLAAGFIRAAFLLLLMA